MKAKKILALLLSSVMLSACASQDISVVDQNGKKINVSSVDKNTYQFKLPTIENPSVYEWDNPYMDVTEENWFYNAVRYCHENKLMSGTAKNTFEPNTSTSRAMVVSILWRLEGCPDTGRNVFSDVSDEAYYADAVAWAAAEGIVSGHSKDIFAPNDPITREQLASILYRYAKYNDWNLSINTSIDHFTDSHIASSYAVEALSWAASHGIINGMEDNLLTPQGSATRAQTASILMNICENTDL